MRAWIHTVGALQGAGYSMAKFPYRQTFTFVQAWLFGTMQTCVGDEGR